MIAVVPLPPTPGQVVLGILAVLAGSFATALAVRLARRTGNGLHYVAGLGGLLLVAGVVGQRTVNGTAPLGAWDAGIEIPVIGVHVNVVAAAGVILILVGATLTLLLERIPSGADAKPPLIHRRLEDDDAV